VNTFSETLQGGEIDESIDVLKGAASYYLERHYGPNSAEPKLFHCPEHTLVDVVPAGQKLAEAAIQSGAITVHEGRLLIIGLIGHDLVQGAGAGFNEKGSADLTRYFMGNSGCFSEEDGDTVERIIMATQAHVVDGRIVQSFVTDRLTGLAADADLVGLSLPFLKAQDRARRITLENDPSRTLEGEDFERFVLDETSISCAHTYHTPEAQRLFGPGLERNTHLWRVLAEQYSPGGLNQVVVPKAIMPPIVH
jgi:hypothetical protein